MEKNISIYVSIVELEELSKNHPEIWGESDMLFFPDKARIVPSRGRCLQCDFCEGEATFNCQNLTFEVRFR